MYTHPYSTLSQDGDGSGCPAAAAVASDRTKSSDGLPVVHVAPPQLSALQLFKFKAAVAGELPTN